MLQHSRGLNLAPTEWLHVAAKRNDDRPRLAPVNTDAATMHIRVRGADLTAFLGGQDHRRRSHQAHGSQSVLECARCARWSPCCSSRSSGGRLAGCGGPTVDLARVSRSLDVSTGWHDEGIVDGENKLVPRSTSS